MLLDSHTLWDPFITFSLLMSGMSLIKRMEICERNALTSKFYWDPYGKGGSSSKVESHWNDIESVL